MVLSQDGEDEGRRTSGKVVYCVEGEGAKDGGQNWREEKSGRKNADQE